VEDKLKNIRYFLAGALGILWSVFQLYAAWNVLLDTMILRGTHVAFALSLAFLLNPSFKSKPLHSFVVDLALALLGIFVGLHVAIDFERIVERIMSIDPMTTADMFLGITAIPLILEATRRAVMAALAVFAAIFIAYALTGPYLIVGLKHSGATIGEWVEYLYLSTEGIFGVPTGVSSTYVYLFILFVAFLQSTNVGQFYLDLAFAVTGRARGGAAKAAVVASSFFGTISGSAVANTVGTGSFTIPLIIRSGYKRYFAASVEALSSTGGQIMPPIMGAAAFIMAELTGINYWDICKSAAFPALLFYGSVFVIIHLEAVKSGLKGMPGEELPQLKETLKKGGHLIIPIVVLIGLLALDYTITKAALMSIFAVALVYLIDRRTFDFFGDVGESSKKSYSDAFKTFIQGVKALLVGLGKTLDNGAKMALTVALACICAGIIVGVITLSGLGLRFAGMVETLSGGSLFLALLLVAAASIVLGMGMPTTAAYIMVSTLAVPALVILKVNVLSAHMFAFYFACLSMITPPVALCAYAAAGIAQTGPWKVGFTAMRLGMVAFIVPFMFAYNPALLLIGPWTEVLWACFTSLIGIVGIGAAVVGYLYGPVRLLERLLMAAAAIALIFPGVTSDFVGLPVFLVLFIWNYFRAKKVKEEK